MGPLNVLMVGLPKKKKKKKIEKKSVVKQKQVGTGEYTTGFVGGAMSGSDKKVGVVGLTLFDLRRRGKIRRLSIVGTSGKKFPAISTAHMQVSSASC